MITPIFSSVSEVETRAFQPVVPPRRVVIERDTASPLWFMRCADPCGVCRVCWLGSALDRERVVKMAAWLRYEVVGGRADG